MEAAIRGAAVREQIAVLTTAINDAAEEQRRSDIVKLMHQRSALQAKLSRLMPGGESPRMPPSASSAPPTGGASSVSCADVIISIGQRVLVQNFKWNASPESRHRLNGKVGTVTAVLPDDMFAVELEEEEDATGLMANAGWDDAEMEHFDSLSEDEELAEEDEDVDEDEEPAPADGADVMDAVADAAGGGAGAEGAPAVGDIAPALHAPVHVVEAYDVVDDDEDREIEIERNDIGGAVGAVRNIVGGVLDAVVPRIVGVAAALVPAAIIEHVQAVVAGDADDAESEADAADAAQSRLVIGLANLDPLIEDSAFRHGCKHYRRRCAIVAPCCDRVFPCRFCHDEAEDAAGNASLQAMSRQHTIDRYAVREVVCSLCQHRQPVQANCENCHVRMGRYFCASCKFFDDDTSKGQVLLK